VLVGLRSKTSLELQTKVGPEFEELLYDQAIEFSPRCLDPEPIPRPPDLDDDEDELSDEEFMNKGNRLPISRLL
jgi:hypothetical protein